MIRRIFSVFVFLLFMTSWMILSDGGIRDVGFLNIGPGDSPNVKSNDEGNK